MKSQTEYNKTFRDSHPNYFKEYYDVHPTKQKEANTKWLKKNPFYHMFKSAKKRAKKRGLEFSLLEEDLIIPERCPILDIPLIRTTGGQASDNSPSLDRIDNLKGYTKENIQVISFRANTLKNNATIEELEKILKFLKNVQALQKD